MPAGWRHPGGATSGAHPQITFLVFATRRGAGRSRFCLCEAINPLAGPGDIDAGIGVKFAEDVAQMRLDRLLTEIQLGGDLAVVLRSTTSREI